MIDEKGAIERVCEVLKEEYGSIYAASRQTGIPQTSLSSAMLRGTVNFQMVASVLSNCPRISPDWLILGTGEKYRAAPGEDIRTAKFVEDMLALNTQYNNDIKIIRNKKLR